MPVPYTTSATWQGSTTNTAVTYTTGSTTANTVDIWQTWTTGTSSGILTLDEVRETWTAWQTAYPVRLLREPTEEERRQHRERVERQAREFEEAAQRRREAQEKAEELLLEHLTDEQRRDLAERNSFFVRGSRGNRYRICRGQVQNVLMLDRWGRPYLRLCAHPQRERVPDADAMLAQALMLQTDEDEFTRIANSQAA